MGLASTNIAGDWTFNRNEVESNGFNGIRLEDACDPTSVFTFDSNMVNNNGLDGIQITNYIASDIIMTNNVTDLNGRDGVRIQGFKGDALVGTDILFDNHVSRFNIGDGINITDGAGSITITNSIIGEEHNATTTIVEPGGNATNGIHIVDFSNPADSDRVLIMDNDINGNGAGFGAGISYELNEGNGRLFVSGNQINSNGVGINVMANDRDLVNATGTILDVEIVDNDAIGSLLFGGNASDGLRFFSNGGAIVSLLIDQTGTTDQQIVNNGGNGISFVIGGDTLGFGIISQINATIRNATITGSGGAGITSNAVQDGQLNLLVEDSLVGVEFDTVFQAVSDGTAGNATGFAFNFGQNPNGVVSTITVRDTRVHNNIGSGFVLNSMPGSAVDVALINNTFLNSFLVTPPGVANFRTDGILDGVNPNGQPDGGFGHGILIAANGDASIASPEVDSRVRLLVQANTIDRFTLDGLEIATTGDARVLANIDGNTINNNGDGFFSVGQPDVPFHDGIRLDASGSSTINARLTNNLTTGNADQGVDILTVGTSTINAEFIGNNFGGNDVTEDTNNDPIIDSFINDFVALNGIGSNICLSMSSTFIGLPEALINLSAQEDFVLELDGGTNGLFGLPTPPNIELMDFGSTCDPLITAEELAFEAAGFPPNPPPVQNP